MGTKFNSSSRSFRTGCVVGEDAVVVHLRQEAACPSATALGFGQHLLLGIGPFFPYPFRSSKSP
eukprot:5905555-Pyramimonas_sp.AAC.1